MKLSKWIELAKAAIGAVTLIFVAKDEGASKEAPKQ
jgi:hypothetical protein